MSLCMYVCMYVCMYHTYSQVVKVVFDANLGQKYKIHIPFMQFSSQSFIYLAHDCMHWNITKNVPRIEVASCGGIRPLYHQ
jgi:hypothetical protein